MSLVLTPSTNVSGKLALVDPYSLEAGISLLKLSRKDSISWRLARGMLSSVGVDAVYNGYRPLVVIHRTNIERFGTAGEMIVNDHEIGFHKHDLDSVEYGDTVLLDGLLLTFQSPISRKDKGLCFWNMV